MVVPQSLTSSLEEGFLKHVAPTSQLQLEGSKTNLLNHIVSEPPTHPGFSHRCISPSLSLSSFSGHQDLHGNASRRACQGCSSELGHSGEKTLEVTGSVVRRDEGARGSRRNDFCACESSSAHTALGVFAWVRVVAGVYFAIFPRLWECRPLP